MKCHKCNFKNNEDASFCIKCGERLKFQCFKCNSFVPVYANYCNKCGQSTKDFENIIKEKEKEKVGLDALIHQLSIGKMTIKEARNMFEKIFCEKKLEEFEWNISKTAEAIGIERSNLHRKINYYKIKPPQK